MKVKGPVASPGGVTDPTSELKIDGWRQGLRFAASHLVPTHPKCGHLHGHTYAISCELEGEVPENGMVMDFGIVKDELRAVSEELDHRWMLPREPRHGEVTVDDGIVTYEVDGKRYDVPESDVAWVDVPVCTAEFLAEHIIERLMKEVDWPPEVDRIAVGLDEGHGKGAWAERSP